MECRTHLIEIMDQMFQVSNAEFPFDREKVIQHSFPRQRLGFRSVIQENLISVIPEGSTSIAISSFASNGHLANSKITSISSPFSFCKYNIVCSGPDRLSEPDAVEMEMVSASGSSFCPNVCNNCRACRCNPLPNKNSARSRYFFVSVR